MPAFYSFLSNILFMQRPQIRAILDTNVYEYLYKYDLARIDRLIEKGELVVYGCKVIRDELREIPREFKADGKSYRNILLGIYDTIIGEHSFPVEKIIEVLAEEYWVEYAGGVAKRKLFPDFLIVATATIHNLDIIVSQDDRTMKSNPARKAYEKANQRNGFETPRFISLKELD